MTDRNDDTPDPGATPDGAGGDGGAPDAQAEQVDAMLAESATAVRLFDVRRIIGGLFVIYGLVVGIIGITDGKAAIHKAEGVNINLWTGVGMLILGVIFLLWMVARPAKAPDRATIEAENK